MPKANATTFRRGRKKTGGRKAGVPNKKTRLLKEALLIAAEAAGNKKGRDGAASYFEWAAIKQPASFMALLGRLIPQQLETSHTEIEYRSVDEIRQELTRRGVQLDTIAPELHALANKTGEDPDEQASKQRRST